MDVVSITVFFFFKFGVEVGVELSIVNALYRLRITDQLFKSYSYNRLSNAYFDAKFKKKTPFTALHFQFRRANYLS
jgi:MFS superfamily sulfate permease-like transporter